MSTNRLWKPELLVAAALTALSLLGCSEAANSRRPTKPVTVTVTYKGAPVADATITFISQDGVPSAAYGTTDSAGVTKLTTYEEDDGAVLGKQKVTIIKEEIVGEKPVADQESEDYVPPPGTTPPPLVKHLIPQKYASPDSSPLEAEVASGGPNDFKFEMTD